MSFKSYVLANSQNQLKRTDLIVLILLSILKKSIMASSPWLVHRFTRTHFCNQISHTSNCYLLLLYFQLKIHNQNTYVAWSWVIWILIFDTKNTPKGANLMKVVYIFSKMLILEQITFKFDNERIFNLLKWSKSLRIPDFLKVCQIIQDTTYV